MSTRLDLGIGTLLLLMRDRNNGNRHLEILSPVDTGLGTPTIAVTMITHPQPVVVLGLKLGATPIVTLRLVAADHRQLTDVVKPQPGEALCQHQQNQNALPGGRIPWFRLVPELPLRQQLSQL